jgi:hypothetical protein
MIGVRGQRGQRGQIQPPTRKEKRGKYVCVYGVKVTPLTPVTTFCGSRAPGCDPTTVEDL